MSGVPVKGVALYEGVGCDGCATFTDTMLVMLFKSLFLNPFCIVSVKTDVSPSRSFNRKGDRACDLDTSIVLQIRVLAVWTLKILQETLMVARITDSFLRLNDINQERGQVIKPTSAIP
jgi:hypothetical protein